MADGTHIEWTDASWQVTSGCSVVSPGCTNCYAMRMAARLEAMGQYQYAGLTTKTKAGAVWNGKVRAALPHVIDQPLRWRRPRRIFVDSMADLFHEGVRSELIADVFSVMERCPQHTFQVLTKRAERMRDWCQAHRGHPLPNVWLGVSVEDQPRADERIPLLASTPAATRFLSCEPLLGPIDISPWLNRLDRHAAGLLDGPLAACLLEQGMATGHAFAPELIHWVIAGGESGAGARPMHPDWVRGIRDQCAAAGVPFFFKQWGAWREFDHGSPDEEVDVGTEHSRSIITCATNPGWISRDGRFFSEPRQIPYGNAARLMERVGKKKAGATLDGHEHRAFPK